MRHTYEDDVAYWRQRAEKLLTYNIQLKQQVNDLLKVQEKLLEKIKNYSSQKDIDRARGDAQYPC